MALFKVITEKIYITADNTKLLVDNYEVTIDQLMI